jgi:hypothetical protein
MERKDDQELWDLLGSARTPKVSPFFPRNILRRLREDSFSRSERPWLSWRRLLPISAIAGATAAILIAYIFTTERPPTGGDNDVVAKIDAQDYEVVADLDNLLASEDNNLWDDNSSL